MLFWCMILIIGYLLISMRAVSLSQVLVNLPQITCSQALLSLLLLSYCQALSRRATLWEMIRDYKHATDDLQRLVSILETGENSQNSATPGRTANGSVKDLRKARRRLSSIEEKAKKERSFDLYLIL